MKLITAVATAALLTAITTTVSDPTVNFAVSGIQLAQPLAYMSYHVFQGVYADGKTATASLRTWPHPFIYASWGTFPNAADSIVMQERDRIAEFERQLDQLDEQMRRLAALAAPAGG